MRKKVSNLKARLDLNSFVVPFVSCVFLETICIQIALSFSRIVINFVIRPLCLEVPWFFSRVFSAEDTSGEKTTTEDTRGEPETAHEKPLTPRVVWRHHT